MKVKKCPISILSAWAWNQRWGNACNASWSFICGNAQVVCKMHINSISNFLVKLFWEIFHIYDLYIYIYIYVIKVDFWNYKLQPSKGRIIIFVEYWIWQIWPIFTVGQGSLFNIIKMPCNSLTFQNFVPPFFWHLFLKHIARWSVHLERSPSTNYIHLEKSQLTCQHRVLKKPLYLQVYLVLFHTL